MQIIWEWSHTRNVPATGATRGGWHPYGWLSGNRWARNAPSKDLFHHQSHMHGNPHHLQCYSPSGDSWAQERTSAHGLKVERSWFTIAPSQTKSQMNLSNNPKLGNVVPSFYWITFCFVFLHLPNLSPGSLGSGQVCPQLSKAPTD